MKLKTNSELVALTNKFLEDFFDKAAALESRKRPDNDSYSFNYTLMSALAESDYVQQTEKEQGFPTPSAGTNLFKNLYEENLQGVDEKLLYVLANFDEQMHDDNKFTDIKVINKTRRKFTVKSQNVNFTALVILNEDQSFKSIELSDKKDKFHKLEKGYWLSDNYGEEGIKRTLYIPEYFWLSRIRDINEFYMVLDVVYNEIKDELS